MEGLSACARPCRGSRGAPVLVLTGIVEICGRRKGVKGGGMYNLVGYVRNGRSGVGIVLIGRKGLRGSGEGLLAVVEEEDEVGAIFWSSHCFSFLHLSRSSPNISHTISWEIEIVA